MQEAEGRGNEMVSEALWGERRPRATVFIASILAELGIGDTDLHRLPRISNQ
jgi:hypothetical protein